MKSRPPCVPLLIGLRDRQNGDSICDNDRCASGNGGYLHVTGEYFFSTGLFVRSSTCTSYLYLAYIYSILGLGQYERDVQKQV